MPECLWILAYAAIGLLAVWLLLKLAIPAFMMLYTAPIPVATPGTVKIACIGDSITYGTLVRGRRNNCYPAQLEKLLGSRFSVRNFGVNARAMQKSADFPYWKHKNFKLSSEFAPDVVLIMLGTNDSRKPNWKGLAPYLQDYREMLHHYRSLASQPTVYALTPPTEFVLKNNKVVKYGMIKPAIGEMTVGIKKIAAELGIEVIDINTATAAYPEYFSFDGVHANVKGARHIAETVYAAINAKLLSTAPRST